MTKRRYDFEPIEMPKIREKKIAVDADIGAGVIAQSIVDIAKAMADLNATRLTRAAIVTLLKENSGVPKAQINIVLNNLESLETTWLKKSK